MSPPAGFGSPNFLEIMKLSIVQSRKQLLIGAALAVASGGAALAQNAVLIYGLADLGFVRESGGKTGSVNKLTSGVSGGSRLGFRGVEDLGGGNSAIFTLESGILMDSGALGQGGLLFGRQSFVGLSGGMGTLTLGRQYTPAANVQVEMDPFSTGLAGTSANLLSPGGAGGSNRMDNTIKYLSPVLGGFSTELAYGAGEAAGSASINRQIGGSLGYARGPLTIKLAHHDTKDAAAKSGKVTWVTAKYDFGAFTGYFNHVTNKGSRVFGLLNDDSTDLLLGIAAPVAVGRVMLSYIRKNDRTVANNDANQLALGYIYPLSRRTSFYASYARINNNAPNTSATGFYRVGNSTEQGSGDRAFNFGMRHQF